MSASTENRIPLWKEILKSAGQIINKANSRHFCVLSILFLFPFLFTLAVYPSFHLALFHPDYNFINLTQISLSNFEIIALIIYILFLVLFFLCAIATITYSAVQASYGRPINLISSIKSIRNSFFPLLSTFIVSHTILISTTLILAILFLLLSQILQTFGLIELKSDLNHLLFFLIFALIVLVPILVWLQVNWSLAYVVAVVESKKGYETLKRSANLVKGMRLVSFSMILYYGLVVGGMVVGGSMFLVIMSTSRSKSDQWIILAVILQILESSIMGHVIMNQFLVRNAVLYLYCKDLNDEKLHFEIGDNEFGYEYESLNMI